MNRTAQEKTSALHDLLDTRSRTYESLRSTADISNLTDAPAAGEFAALLREMPVFDLGHLSPTVKRPAIALFLGRSFAERRIANKLAQLGGRF